MTEEEEKESADRVLKRAKKYVPVGKKRIKSDVIWRRRIPGSLRRSIKVKKSKFQEGGYIVRAGNERRIFYAHWVEFGTIFMSRRKGYKYLRKAMNLERSRFTRMLRKNLGV